MNEHIRKAGAPPPARSAICPHCGRPLTRRKPEPPPRKPGFSIGRVLLAVVLIAGLPLWLWLGAFLGGLIAKVIAP